VRTPAPDTGEHSDQILAELGYSPADITSLRNDKVI
jgi:crotonobetainyl-CoA:carnitine CoA-transferase CaiB-like acyl-CoA transferase